MQNLAGVAVTEVRHNSPGPAWARVGARP